MAFTTILRRSASTIALRFAQKSHLKNNNHVAILTALYHTSPLTRMPTSISGHVCSPTCHHYSSLPATKKPSSDQSLIRVIDEEIRCAEESDEHDRVEESPAGFPFEIQDNLGQQTIILTREYQGETIKVDVHMPDLITGEDGADNDDNDNDADSEKGAQSRIPLVVTVSKRNGLSLEFSVIAFPDEIAIESLAIRDPENSEDQIAYEGPDFSDLDENLQKAFHKYLEIRGIKPSTTNFLHEYMINKDSREYSMWLKNLKQFVAA